MVLRSRRDRRNPPHQFLLPRTASEQRKAEKRWEEMLTALANMPDEPFIPEGWPVDYGFPVVEHSDFAKYMQTLDYFRSRFPEMFKDQCAIDLMAFRDLVRRAWTAADRRLAEWYLFQARRIRENVRRGRESKKPEEFSAILKRAEHRDRHYRYLVAEAQHTVKGKLDFGSAYARAVTIEKWREAEESGPPPLTPFEEIICHLQENLHRTRYCKNPTCTTPHFFLTTHGHKGQGQEYCSPDCIVWGKREKKKLWARKNRERGRK